MHLWTGVLTALKGNYIEVWGTALAGALPNGVWWVLPNLKLSQIFFTGCPITEEAYGIFVG